MMGLFGWSLPPGCGKLPGEEDDGITKLQDDVLELLEAANIPTDVNDKIIDLIRNAEIAKFAKESATDADAFAQQLTDGEVLSAEWRRTFG